MLLLLLHHLPNPQGPKTEGPCFSFLSNTTNKSIFHEILFLPQTPHNFPTLSPSHSFTSPSLYKSAFLRHLLPHQHSSCFRLFLISNTKPTYKKKINITKQTQDGKSSDRPYSHLCCHYFWGCCKGQCTIAISQI